MYDLHEKPEETAQAYIVQLESQLMEVRALLKCVDVRLAELGDTHTALVRWGVRNALAQIEKDEQCT